mgnify:FL=1
MCIKHKYSCFIYTKPHTDCNAQTGYNSWFGNFLLDSKHHVNMSKLVHKACRYVCDCSYSKSVLMQTFIRCIYTHNGYVYLTTPITHKPTVIQSIVHALLFCFGWHLKTIISFTITIMFHWCKVTELYTCQFKRLDDLPLYPVVRWLLVPLYNKGVRLSRVTGTIQKNFPARVEHGITEG